MSREAGGFLGRFLSGRVAEGWGWRGSFLILAAYALMAFLVVVRWLPGERCFCPSVRSMELRRHFRNGRLLATCLVGGCIMFVQVASFTYGGLQLGGPPHHLGSRALGSVFGVFLLGVGVTPLAGRAIASHGRIPTFVAAWGLSSLGLMLCALPRALAIVAGLALCSTGIFSGQACATGYAAEVAGSSKAGGVGLYLAFYYVAASLGAVVPAPVFRHWGWTGCIQLMLLILSFGLGCAVFAWRRQGEAGVRRHLHSNL